MKEYLDFSTLEKSERDWYLQNTWCSICGKPDLGIDKPELYLQDGVRHISGNCKICSCLCISTLVE